MYAKRYLSHLKFKSLKRFLTLRMFSFCNLSITMISNIHTFIQTLMKKKNNFKLALFVSGGGRQKAK